MTDYGKLTAGMIDRLDRLAEERERVSENVGAAFNEYMDSIYNTIGETIFDKFTDPTRDYDVTLLAVQVASDLAIELVKHEIVEGEFPSPKFDTRE